MSTQGARRRLLSDDRNKADIPIELKGITFRRDVAHPTGIDAPRDTLSAGVQKLAGAIARQSDAVVDKEREDTVASMSLQAKARQGTDMAVNAIDADKKRSPIMAAILGETVSARVAEDQALQNVGINMTNLAYENMGNLAELPTEDAIKELGKYGSDLVKEVKDPKMRQRAMDLTGAMMPELAKVHYKERYAYLRKQQTENNKEFIISKTDLLKNRLNNADSTAHAAEILQSFSDTMFEPNDPTGENSNLLSRAEQRNIVLEQANIDLLAGDNTLYRAAKMPRKNSLSPSELVALEKANQSYVDKKAQRQRAILASQKALRTQQSAMVKQGVRQATAEAASVDTIDEFGSIVRRNTANMTALDRAEATTKLIKSWDLKQDSMSDFIVQQATNQAYAATSLVEATEVMQELREELEKLEAEGTNSVLDNTNKAKTFETVRKLHEAITTKWEGKVSKAEKTATTIGELAGDKESLSKGVTDILHQVDGSIKPNEKNKIIKAGRDAFYSQKKVEITGALSGQEEVLREQDTDEGFAEVEQQGYKMIDQWYETTNKEQQDFALFNAKKVAWSKTVEARQGTVAKNIDAKRKASFIEKYGLQSPEEQASNPFVTSKKDEQAAADFTVTRGIQGMIKGTPVEAQAIRASNPLTNGIEVTTAAGEQVKLSGVQVAGRLVDQLTKEGAAFNGVYIDNFLSSVISKPQLDVGKDEQLYSESRANELRAAERLLSGNVRSSLTEDQRVHLKYQLDGLNSSTSPELVERRFETWKANKGNEQYQERAFKNGIDKAQHVNKIVASIGKVDNDHTMEFQQRYGMYLTETGSKKDADELLRTYIRDNTVPALGLSVINGKHLEEELGFGADLTLDGLLKGAGYQTGTIQQHGQTIKVSGATNVITSLMGAPVDTQGNQITNFNRLNVVSIEYVPGDTAVNMRMTSGVPARIPLSMLRTMGNNVLDKRRAEAAGRYKTSAVGANPSTYRALHLGRINRG